MQKLICLNNASDVKRFIKLTQNCTGEVTVSSPDEKYRVDGKSILGVFSLDLAEKVLVTVENESDAEFLFSEF